MARRPQAGQSRKDVLNTGTKEHQRISHAVVPLAQRILILGGATNPFMTNEYDQISLNDSVERLTESIYLFNKYMFIMYILSCSLLLGEGSEGFRGSACFNYLFLYIFKIISLGFSHNKKNKLTND